MGNLNVYVDLGGKSPLKEDTTLMEVMCGGDKCPAATSCAIGTVLLSAEGSILKDGGTASLAVNVYQGPETPENGDDFELVGSLDLGTFQTVPNNVSAITEQAAVKTAVLVSDHVTAGSCVLRLAQEQANAPV